MGQRVDLEEGNSTRSDEEKRQYWVSFVKGKEEKELMFNRKSFSFTH